jgi:homoserine acetyltransferase
MMLDDLFPAMYHDVEPKEAKELISKLRPHAVATITDKTRSAAWKKIPTSYLVCEDDKVFPAHDQDGIIAMIKEQRADVESERLFVGHSPYIVKPDAVAAFIRRAAGEKEVQ